MKSILFFDFTVLIKRKKFIRILLFETIAACLASLVFFCGKHPSYSGSPYEFSYLINGKFKPLAMILLTILPILSSLPNADIDFEEDFIKEMIQVRCGVNKYYLSKHLLAFATGFVNILYCFELLYLLQRIAIPLSGGIFVSDGSSLDYLLLDQPAPYFLGFLFSHPLFFTHFQFLLCALFGGFCAEFSYVLSQWVRLPSLTYLNSFISSFAASIIIELSGLPVLFTYYSALSLLNPQLKNYSSNGFMLCIIISWCLIYFLLSIILQYLHCRFNES